MASISPSRARPEIEHNSQQAGGPAAGPGLPAGRGRSRGMLVAEVPAGGPDSLQGSARSLRLDRETVVRIIIMIRVSHGIMIVDTP